MRAEVLLKTTGFTTNVFENTKIRILGKCSLIFLTTFHLQLSFKDKFSELMEVFLQTSLLLMIFENLTDFRKFLMKDQSVIYYGVILMRDSALIQALEELGGLSDK